MSDPVPGGRKLLASNRRIDPILAAGAPHDPMLAIECGLILLDDCEAMVAALPTAETISRLPAPQRVTQCKAVLAQLDRARFQIDDARTLVRVAFAEARAAA